MLLRELSPILTSAFTLQDIDIKVGKLAPVHIEVVGSVRIVVRQIGTCPVQNRHEVVTDALDAFLTQVAETLLVNLNLMITVRTTIFQGFNNRQRLYHTPFHTIRLNVLLEFMNLLACPNLAQRNIVQCGNNALNTNLLQLCKCNLIFLAKPAPCSFHIYYIMYKFKNELSFSNILMQCRSYCTLTGKEFLHHALNLLA